MSEPCTARLWCGSRGCSLVAAGVMAALVAQAPPVAAPTSARNGNDIEAGAAIEAVADAPREDLAQCEHTHARHVHMKHMHTRLIVCASMRATQILHRLRWLIKRIFVICFFKR